MELEEQARREIIERQKEDMIRQIAFDTGTLAQHLRPLRRIILNLPTDSLAEARNPDFDALLADQVHDLEEEQRRLYNERLRAMIEEVDREMYGPRDVPSQLTDESVHVRVPAASGDLFRPPSFPRVPIGSCDLLRVPTGPGIF